MPEGAESATRLTLPAPAKVNLRLRVLGRRPDGYHELDAVFHTIGLCDEVTLSDAPEGVRVTCSDPALAGVDNLAAKAARAVLDRLEAPRGVAIRLIKRIPAGAGLGGGSSDAAAVLKGLNRLWGLGWPPETLAGIGAGVGSDVPFFVYGGAARVRGRGEWVTPVVPRTGTWCLLVYPGVAVSTAEVYAAHDRGDADARGRRGLTARAGGPIMGRAPEGAGPRSDDADAPFNDLEAAACRVAPEIGNALTALREAGAQDARMTGSGSAVFCLGGSRAVLEDTRERLDPAPHWNVWLVPLTAAEVP